MTTALPPEFLPEQLLLIDPKTIFIPDRLRKVINETQLRELTESISKTGQIHPIRVRPIEDDEGGISSGQWALVAGFRRLQAVTALGLFVKALNYDRLSNFQRRRIELEENLHRQDFTWQEVAEGKKMLHDLFMAEMGDQGWTQEQTAKVLGETPSNLAKALKVANAMELDPSIKNANSRKAAQRLVEMKLSHSARLARSEQATNDASTVRSKLFCGDARDYVRSLPSGSIDLVFTDLPYGIDYYSKPDGTGQITKQNQGGISKYDDTPEAAKDLMVDLVPQLFRVTQENGWIAIMMNEANYGFLRDLMQSCCATHFEYVDAHDETDECVYLPVEEPHWIWYRSNSHMPSMYPERHAQNQYERILLLNRGGARLSYPCGNVLDIENEYGGERWHAMQKPLTLCKEIINRLSLPGERVLDPTFGSGNLLKAASMMSRDFRGSELNPDLYDLAVGSITETFGGEVLRNDPIVQLVDSPEDEIDESEYDSADV